MKENCSEITEEEECVFSRISACDWKSDKSTCENYDLDGDMKTIKIFSIWPFVASIALTVYIMYIFFYKKNYKGKDIISGYSIIIINLLVGLIYPGNTLLNVIPELKNDIETFNDYLDNLNNPVLDFNLRPAVEGEGEDEEEAEEEARVREERRVKEEEEKEEIISIVNKIKSTSIRTAGQAIMIGIVLLVLLLLGLQLSDTIRDSRNAPASDERP